MYNTARKYLANTYNSEQYTYLQRQIDNIQSAADNKQSAIACDILNKISGRKSVNKTTLKVNSHEDRIHIWKDYFSKLLGSIPSQNVQQIKAIREDDIIIKTGPFTMNELILVLKNIKLKKTT